MGNDGPSWDTVGNEDVVAADDANEIIAVLVIVEV
jgi:hypothetical protein